MKKGIMLYANIYEWSLICWIFKEALELAMYVSVIAFCVRGAKAFNIYINRNGF